MYLDVDLAELVRLELITVIEIGGRVLGPHIPFEILLISGISKEEQFHNFDAKLWSLERNSFEKLMIFTKKNKTFDFEKTSYHHRERNSAMALSLGVRLSANRRNRA